MEICGYAPNLSSTGGSWTAYHMSYRITVYPYFLAGDDDTVIDVGYLTETKTDWVMHGSRQNFCYNVHYRGKCYRFPDLQPGSDSSHPDLPFWKLFYKNPSGASLSKWINYPFPMSTGFDVLTHQEGYDGSVAPGWRRVNAAFGIVNICERIPHPVHPEWECYAMYCKASAAYTSEDSNSAAFGWLPSKNITEYVDSDKTIPIYLFGKKTSTYQAGRIRGHLFQDPWTLEVKFTPNYSSVTWNSESYLSPIADVDKVKQSVKIELPNYDDRLFFSPETAFGLNYDWESAMTQGLNQVNFFDSNGMAFAHDVASLPTTILSDVKNLRQLAKADPTGKLKIAASTFLSVHYGYKLLAADGIELANELADYTTTHTLHVGQTVDPSIEAATKGDRRLTKASGHLNVYYDPYAQIESEIGKFAEAVDLTPDFSNVWDMIPFSFVVDWFTNVGDLAQGIDNYFTLTQQHKVLGCIRSRKVSYVYEPAGFFGTVECTRYTRSPSEGWFPTPKFSFQFQNPVTNLYHWLEGSAMVVSKIV